MKISWTHLISGILLLYVSIFIIIESNPNVLHPTLITGAGFLILLIGLVLFIQHILAMDKNETSKLMAAICVIGIFIAGFLLYAHYTSAKELCPPPTEGEIVPCDVVNHSPYASLFGIPVALIGLAGYIFMLALAFFNQKQDISGSFLAIILLALAFTIYLNYVQLITLITLCMFCEFSAISIIMLMLCGFRIWAK